MDQTDQHKKHKIVDSQDQILEDIYQVLYKIANEMDVFDKNPEGEIELKEPAEQTLPAGKQVLPTDRQEESEEVKSLSDDELRQSIKKADKKQLKCDICGKYFKTEHGLKIHKNKIHGLQI